jgi:hypothetical protein
MSSPHSDEESLKAAHRHSIRHREEIFSSDLCGCFYCLRTFPPSEIEDWIKEPKGGGMTAMCPGCGIDSVIGSASGFPLTPEFLRLRHQEGRFYCAFELPR